MNITKAIERATTALARRQAALKDTLAEITYLEEAKVPPLALYQVKVKRDRQHNACVASEQVIAALTKKK